jgi:hypothetical protein
MNRDLGVWTYEDCALLVGLGVAGAGALLARAISGAQQPPA